MVAGANSRMDVQQTGFFPAGKGRTPQPGAVPNADREGRVAAAPGPVERRTRPQRIKPDLRFCFLSSKDTYSTSLVEVNEAAFAKPPKR
jgi:hypothetical protein